MNNDMILELIPYNESAIVLYESSFQDIIERIKAYFHKLLIRIREFFTKLTNAQKITITTNTKWINDNKEAIEKGYKLFKSIHSTISGKNVFDIVDVLKKEISVNFDAISYTNILKKDLGVLVDAFKNKHEDFPVSELLNMDPKEEYIVNASSITGHILATDKDIEYHNIGDALDNAIKERSKYKETLSDIDIKDIIRYASDNYDKINNTYKDMIRYLEVQLSNVSSIGSRYKSEISLFSPSYRGQANKILDRARVLINDYISLVTLVHNRFLSYTKIVRHQAMNMLKLYAEFDNKDQITPNEEYDANGKLLESYNGKLLTSYNNSLLESYGIFESAKFI